MLTIDRDQRILDLLGQRGEIAVCDLAQTLGVSEATVRRDLETLARRGLLRRRHGGATLAGVASIEPLFREKEDSQPEAKQALAQAALALIQDGDEIYLDGGSTVLQLARLLHRKRDLTIVTNSLMAAAALVDTAHRVILVGGELRSRSRTMIGPLTAPLIQSLRVGKAFMGTLGFTLEDGMSTTDPGEAYTKSLIMARAQQVILLVDHSKFGLSSFATSGRLEDIDLVLTDRIDPAWRQALAERGVQVLLPVPSAAPTPA